MHLVADGHGRGLAVLLTPGQAGDAPMLAPLLEAVAVPRLDGGPPRRNPQVVIADKTSDGFKCQAAAGCGACVPGCPKALSGSNSRRFWRQ